MSDDTGRFDLSTLVCAWVGAPSGARHARESRVSPSSWRRTTGKRVILNMTAQAETAREFFHSPNGHMALKPDRGFQAETAPAGNNDHTLQALTKLEWLAGDAIESFAAEIFGNALHRWSSGLSEQTHRPMQWKPRASAAVIR